MVLGFLQLFGVLCTISCSHQSSGLMTRLATLRNVGQQMENEANDDAVYPTEQLRRLKERAMTAIGRQTGSYDVSREMTDFSHKAADSAGKITGTGHSEA